MEAKDGHLMLTGREVEATIPATVYEPGVLFLRITDFRLLLGEMREHKMITVQANQDGLLLDNARFDLASNDMLLYLDPARAPMMHPSES
jgi:hypothetical protein